MLCFYPHLLEFQVLGVPCNQHHRIIELTFHLVNPLILHVGKWGLRSHDWPKPPSGLGGRTDMVGRGDGMARLLSGPPLQFMSPDVWPLFVLLSPPPTPENCYSEDPRKSCLSFASKLLSKLLWATLRSSRFLKGSHRLWGQTDLAQNPDLPPTTS